MKRTLTTIIAAMLLSLALNAQDLKVISYNIRNSQEKDGTNSWVYRYAASAEMVQDQKADVIGLQEALSDQVRFFEQNFKDYKWAGESATILWNRKTVTLQKSGSFDVATWALFKDKETGRKFYVVNVDLDKTPAEERKAAVAQVIERTEALNKESLPVVITGGFFMKPGDAALADLDSKMTNARKSAEKTDNTGTYNNWGKTSEIRDHIYYAGFTACPEYQTITKKYTDRKFISDHFPLMVQLTF
jgi:endonuclease/exonuclease/phosphatase family metal-dependent hydrolase